MAKTFTYAQTKTFARIDLLKMQIRIALRRTAGVSDDTLRRLELGIENHWIRRILVYGIGNEGLCRAELVLEIDWHEHEAQLSVGRATVTIDQRWTNDTAIEVEEVITFFNAFVGSHSLATHTRIQYPDWVYKDEAMHRHVQTTLGFVKAEPVKWAGQGEGGVYQVPELPEFSVGCHVVFD